MHRTIQNTWVMSMVENGVFVHPSCSGVHHGTSIPLQDSAWAPSSSPHSSVSMQAISGGEWNRASLLLWKQDSRLPQNVLVGLPCIHCYKDPSAPLCLAASRANNPNCAVKDPERVLQQQNLELK